jgi:hypothetical protein
MKNEKLLHLKVEELEARIAPGSGSIGNPGTSEAPQVPSGASPQPNPMQTSTTH